MTPPQESLAELRDRKVKRYDPADSIGDVRESCIDGFDECAKLLEQKEREYDEAMIVLDKTEAFGSWASACISDEQACSEAKADASKYLEALGLARALIEKHRGKG